MHESEHKNEFSVDKALKCREIVIQCKEYIRWFREYNNEAESRSHSAGENMC
jgi:hypothetical protein